MRIGFLVQGTNDEAVVRGLAARYCPDAELVAGVKRGISGESLRRELKVAIHDLKTYKSCDYVVILTDSDENPWREVKQREWSKVPDDCKHMTLFGVAERNIECWLAADRAALARELGCLEQEIPRDDPSGFVGSHFRPNARERISRFVSGAPLSSWIENNKSFGNFWDEIFQRSKSVGCQMPNERQKTQST